MARYDERKSITFFIGILNAVASLVWGALYLLTMEVVKNIGSPSSMLLYIATFFFVAMGAVILPNLEKGSGKKGIAVGTGLSWLAALLYGAYVALYITKYDEVVRKMIPISGG